MTGLSPLGTACRLRRSLGPLPELARGYTLVEPMITATIIALLASVAYPTYQQQMRKLRRAEAKNALSRAAMNLERAFTASTDGRHLADTDFARLFGLAGSSNAYSSADSAGRGRFQLVYTRGADTRSYTLRATASTSATPDERCSELGLDERGTRSIVGTGSVDLCWQ